MSLVGNGARWGMNEREIREAFSSKLLVPLAGKQPAETVLSIPGYVFLGCPFDVTFRFAGARGLVRINLSEVGNLLGHHGNGIAGYGAACKLIDRRLEDMFGRGQAKGAEKSWTFPLADVTSGGADAGRAHVTFARHVDTQQRAQGSGASRGIPATSLRARDWVLILQWERPLHDGEITPSTDARN